MRVLMQKQKVGRISLKRGEEVEGASESYVVEKRLGSGGFGTVYKATRQGDNVAVAIKLIDITAVSDRTKKYFDLEIKIMEKLYHPNIVRISDVIKNEKEQTIYIVMEYVRGGTLGDYLREKPDGLDEDEARVYFRQIISALEYCHENKIYHRDLKPYNILFDRDNKEVKVCDFGLGALGHAEQGMPSPKFHSPVGTTYYKAPEVHQPSLWGYSGASADIWSCGVTLLVMVTGRQRLLGKWDTKVRETFIKIVRDRNEMNFGSPWQLSPELAHLIHRMLEPTAELRIRIGQIKEHPWYKGDRKWIAYEKVAREAPLRPYRKTLCVRFESLMPERFVADFFTHLVYSNANRLSLQCVSHTAFITDNVSGVSLSVRMFECCECRTCVEITHADGTRKDFRAFYGQWFKEKLKPLHGAPQQFLYSNF